MSGRWGKVEQEQIQKRTFTNWVNAQLAKRRPPCMVVDLFSDFRDGSKLLDLLEVMSGQHISRERGRGMFQQRSNIEKALAFLKKKSIKLVNINIPDIIDGRPSIILGLIWTIILQYHIEELASGLSFDSRQSSMESLASLDSRSTLSSRSASSSPVPPRGSPLHSRFRVSAKKALLLWVREQCHKAGCTINVKDFKASWRSGVVFLAILYALQPDLVDLSKARTRSNKQNLEEAFRIAERELRIPRLLEPDDVDVRDPDEKSIMTYVAQFLQYSRDLPVSEEEMQATPDRKAQEVTCWLVQAYDELLEGWDSTEGESYSERYHVFQTFLVSFNEQRRPIMPLLTAMRRTQKLSEEQRALREAWDSLTEKLREYKIELDKSLPAPMNTVACWLLKAEGVLAEEGGDPQDHGRAADDAKEKQELLRVCLEEMPQQLRTFQSFQNQDEYGNMMVPADKMEELKRRFTGVKVTAKYHGIKLEYREHRHTVLDLLGQIRTKLRVWKRPYISPEAVRVLLQEWHELVNTQELPSLLEAALHKLKKISEKYSSKSALAADYHHVSQQVKQLEDDTAVVLEELTTTKSTMGRVLSAWDSYSDSLSSLQAWLEQGSATFSPGHRPELTPQSVSEWGSRHAHLNEVGNFLIESTDPQSSRSLAEELRRLNMNWAEFIKRNTFNNVPEPSAEAQTRPQDPQALIREATLILREPVEAMAGPLRTYRKRIQFIMRKLKEVDVDALMPSPECPTDQLQKVKLAMPEVMQTLFEAEQVCAELQHSVSGLDSRLAELLHWETEARDLYQLLRAAEQQKQRGQDPRARVLISRGLQLEGQVVTEEQDLQVMVMTNQKSSPIQYLHASAIQDRVRAAVAQSQETVGMLSSLGARRDRSRSPPDDSPPSKVLVQTKQKPQHLRQSDTSQLMQQPVTKLVSHQVHETFVPTIVVQEYREEKMPSPPMPYSYAQAVVGTRATPPPEVQTQLWSETAAQSQQQTLEQRLIQKQEQLQQQEQTSKQKEKEMQQQELKQQQQTQQVQQQMATQLQQQQQKNEQQQVEQQHQTEVQQQVVTQVQVETQVKQMPASKKQLFSSSELQSKKARAMKNRPWLQKPVSGEQKPPGPTSEQDSAQEPKSDKETASVRVVPQQTGSPKLQPEAKTKPQPQQQKKEPQKQTRQPQSPDQQQGRNQQQQRKEQRPEKQHKQQEQLLQPQKQPQQPQPTVRRTQPNADTKGKSKTVTKAPTTAQSAPQAVAQAQTATVSTAKTMSQTRVSQGQSQTQVLSQAHGPVKTQPQLQAQAQTQTQAQAQAQVQTQAQAQAQVQSQVQSQTCVPVQPQPGLHPHSQVQAHGPALAQVRPSSPMQAPLPGQIQTPVPSHVQLRSHPQSWSPVRPPSPKPPTPTADPQTHSQPMAHPPPKAHPQAPAQSMAQVQTHPQPKAHPQAQVQPMVWTSQAQPLPQRHTQVQPGVPTQYSTPAQVIVQQPAHPSQGQLQTWPQVRTSSPMSVQYPQAAAQPQLYPHGYSQAQSPPQTAVWTPQQRHPIPPPYHPETNQALQSQAHPAVQALPQWAQTGPQVGAPGYTHMGPSYAPPQMQPQPQTQTWAQTQPQMRPHSPMQQPQMRPYNVAHIPTQQGQVQQQTRVQTPPQFQPQPFPRPPSQQYAQVPHQHQPQHYPQPQMQTQKPLQSQPQHPAHPQHPSQPQLQPQLQTQTQTHIPTQAFVQPQRSQLNLQFQELPSQPKHQAQLQPQPKPQDEKPSQPKPQAQLAPQPAVPSPSQTKVQPAAQPKAGSVPQPAADTHLPPQPVAQSPTTPKAGSPPQPRPQTQPAPQPEVQPPTQTRVQSPPQPKAGSPPQPRPQTQPAPQPEPQPPTQTKVQSPPQPKAGSPPQSKPQTQPAPQPEVQPPTQTKVQSPPQPKAGSPPQSKPQTQPAPQPEPQPLTQTKVQSPPQQRAQSQPQPKPQTQLPPQNQLQAQSPPLAKAQTTTHSKAQSPPQSRPQTQPPPQSPPQPKPQHPQTVVLSQVSVLPQSQAESPDLCFTPPALAQAPPQAYTEAYAKAQALARNGFEEAKHCLQEHILEAINVFKEKRISPDQSSVKEETLKTLDPELLEGFLRAAKGMEAFCTPSELRDMEFFTQSVRTQWEAVRAEISGYLQQLQFEVTKTDFNRAALQCEMHLSSQLEKQAQACFSVDGSFAQAGQHLEALKELCDTLSPEDAHRLAQTQLRECEKRLAAIQHQFSGDQDTSLPDSRISVAFSEDLTTEKERDKPQVSAEVSQVTVKTASVEKKEVVKQVSLEEEVTKKEALERYENCKRTLQAQLSKNDQSIKDTPSDSVSLKGLHTRLQEIQFLRQETGSLWAEYGNVCSQCSQLTGNTGLEQEKLELQEQWRSQQLNLQRRGNSLAAALRQIDSTENHMVDFTDRLDRYLRQPKDITAFSLANTNILKDIKELDDNIQYELDQLSRMDSESSDLDPRDCFPLTREVETHRMSLDQLRQQVRKSEAAARALDRFLMSLRTVDEDISGVQGAPCSDATVLQDCRSKLSLIRQSIDSLKEKAPQLDLLLQGARLTVTRDGVPASCLDMVSALLRRLEEADSGLASQQQDLKKETQSKSLGLRKRTLLGEMRKLQETIEMQGLKEPTIPAVQHRLRALTDLDSQVHAQHSEFLNISELQEKQGGGENLLEELETQWKEIQRGFSDRKKQCTTLLENLKKFQSCRSHLTNTIQRAEHTISDQASYMGKDNLQRSITKVSDIKEELSGLGERMEEMRGVCRQLQTQLKKFPDCSESPFEAEADTLMDNWLDVTEKTDAYMDNLKVALELLEKQLMLGGEVDGWAVAKLTLFAESHPFSNEQQVLAMRDEIRANEENIEHFHKKSVEIQELLQSQEAPLELQVMETQLRRRMEQVKELFTDCTDVFEELIAVKKHLAEKIEECQAAVENIQASLSKVDASGSKVEEQIQDLCEDLEAREEQAESVLKEVGLVSSVASPQVLEALAVDCRRLREAISRTKDMIHLKREERDKGLLKVIHDEKQSFEGWLQDLQLLVNECFENPESRADVELYLQRLTGFLKSKDGERRLEQLKVQLERGSQQIPPQQLSDFTEWLKEQQEEVGTFRTHCHNRQTEMESLLGDLNSLQKQHDGFREWLQSKEKESVVLDKVKPLLKDLQDESGRAKSLSELLASVRRQGVRGESLLKNSDNLIQRYRNLEARLQEQAQAQSALQEECDRFHSQTESTRTWIRELLEPLTSSDRDVQTEELKCIAQTILISKAEGEYKVSNLVNQSQNLCEHEDLDQSRKQEIQESVRQTEEQWQAALQAAREALSKAETQTLLDQDLLSFKTLNEHVQSWIGEQEQNLQSGGGQVGEKLQIAQAALSSRSEGDSKLHDLKKQCQSLCENQALDESRRQELQDAVKQKEEQWSRVLKAAEEAHNKAEAEAASEQDFEGFKTQSGNVQFWIKEQKQKLLSLSSQMQFEERLQIVQAMLTSRAEGEAKLQDLKRRGESVCEQLEERRRPEVQLLVDHTEQQWRSVLQAANQAELRSLSDDFDTQSKNTQSWIRDRQQKLQSVGSHTPPEERCNTVETILSSRPEGDCKVNNLRRRGQSLCDHKDTDEGRRVYVQQTVRETEEQWRTVLQAAKQIKAAAEAQIAQETERRELEVRELREFETGQQDNGRWLGDLQQRLVSLDSQSNAEDRLHIAQDIMSCKPDGDSRLQELRRRGQILYGLDLEEHRKRDIEQIVKDAEEEWTRVLQHAKLSLVKAEKAFALQGQLRDFETLRTNTRTWLEEKQHSLISLDGQTEAEKIINTAQTILSSKPEGDSKLTELRRQSQSLCEHEDLEEDTRREAQQAVKDSEERWRTVLQTAEDTLKKAEVQYSISREMEALSTQALSTKSWVKDLQEQAEAKGRGTQGSKAELEDRLNTAQVILSNKSSGEVQVKELQSRAQSLCEQRNLEEEKKLQVQQMVGDIEQQWRTLLQAAEDTHRELKGVVQRLESCQRSRVQAEARLTELQNQTSNLPRLFPWPGLGERRQAVEQAQTLLDQATALAPVLSDLHTQATELFEITQDHDWADPSFAANQESIPALLRELTDAVANLEQGIVTERQCTQLVEQHEAAQDWLREQVKGLGTPPTDRQGLHSTVNTLKALLQTVGREQREMKELDSARDNLLSLCTPGGHDALILEVSQLHSLCATSEREVRERLTACEARLGEQQSQLARRVQDLRERAAALQWELRSLDQALSYSEPQNNIIQLLQHWHSLQNCENALEDLGVKLRDLHQDIKPQPATSELPAEIVSVVDSLCQQHDSLKSRLSERQGTCSTNTARCLTDCLQAVQQWNHSEPSDSVSSLQVTLEEGEKLQITLREALSQQRFLTDCLTPVLFEKLEKECSQTLKEAEAHKDSLNHSLKELNEKKKQKLHDIQSADVLPGNLEQKKTSVVAPPRKSKQAPEKKHQVVHKSSTDVIPDEVTQVEGLTPRENKAKESDVKTEKVSLEAPGGFTISSIFTEVQLLPATGPSSPLSEGKSLEDSPETLVASTTDLDACLSRLVSKVLSLKNCPAELSLEAMAQQVEEAQRCRETAQQRVSSLSQQRGADDGESRTMLDSAEDQWSKAAQDAAAVIQSKEAQLQLVTDYCRQTQRAETTLDTQTAQLDAVKKSPDHSVSREAEQLSSLQRSMVENQTVFGELLLTYTKLCPHLSQSEHAAAQTKQKDLQEKWRSLERTVEMMLHHTKVHFHETSSLQSEISGLQEHLEKLNKDLEAKSPAATQWNCKKAQQLMESNAEVEAAQQKYLHRQQLSEVLLLSSRWKKETEEIQQGLQTVKDKLTHIEELVSAQTLCSSNPIMEKIIEVMTDGLGWAKKSESDIEGRRKRVALLPEEVHRQLRDLKKLQSEVMVKQVQLETLAEEVTELLPQLDQVEEVPMVRTSLESLEQISKSTTDKLVKAVREIESGLQTREKLSEQIADLDSWVVAHLHREATRSPDSEFRSPSELDHRVHQIQETLAEADKQAAVCEALLMKSKDISSELSITENCQLFEKLTNLQEDIRAISSCEKASQKELDELIQSVESNKKTLGTVEKSLKQMLVDLNKYSFPITQETLQALEPFKHMILEHKSQLELLQPRIPQEMTRELHSVISELYSKMVSLEMKATDHERYLDMRQCVEDLREAVEKQVHQTKDDSEELVEKYKVCQCLLVQFPLITCLCGEARAKLQMISADLHPSQLTAEQQRLKQNEENLNSLELTLHNNLNIIEENLLKDLDLESEKKATQAFLLQTQQKLQTLSVLEPNDTAIIRGYQKVLSLKKMVESRMRALEVIEQKKGEKQGSGSKDLMALKDAVLSECDSKMESIFQAREALRSYTWAVKQAVQFLGDVEATLLPPQGPAGLCSDRLEETQEALAALQEQFQTSVDHLKSQFGLHSHLCPEKVQQLLEDVLSQLLVKLSTLQAKGHIQLESLSRCAESHRNYTHCHDEIMASVTSAESSLSQFTSEKVTCLTDCTDQEAKLRALSEEVESLLRRLEELQEWCPEQSCRGGREAAVAAVWRRVSRLHRRTQELAARSKERIAEWSDITNSVEKATTVLEQVEAELPKGLGLKASTEEIHDLLQSWEQYQDRLDCEHRALSALELRAARLLGVPAHLEEAPPTPLCQQLQAMQARYDSVKKSSTEGLEAARMELEDRDKVRDELQGIRVWVEAADELLSEMEASNSTQELQEVHSQLYSQKALLQHVVESMKKYGNIYKLVPPDIDNQLTEVKWSLQQVEVKMGQAVKRSGPVHKLGAKLSEIHAGLSSVQKKLDQRSPTVVEAKVIQKRVWDDLDMWHSSLAMLEGAIHDLEKPQDVLSLTERLVEVQQLHSQLSKQAEQRTTLLSKIHTWLQEHQEMISSSKSWMTEAQSWLAAPCTYTTAKCLSSHVHALQVVLNDSEQIRTTLQGFGSVLEEMSLLIDVTTLQEQLLDADQQVAEVQDSFTAPLSQLEHAADEVEAIESEVRRMENDVAEIKTLLSSPETFPSPREESLKVVEQKIQTMRRTVAEIQKCKPGLCLPENAEETLTVFTVVDDLQTLLLELEKKVPAVYIQQPPTPVQAKALSAEEASSQSKPLKSTSEAAEGDDVEQGQIQIVHVEEDVLRRSGATLQTVEQTSPEQRQTWSPDAAQRGHQAVLRAEEAAETKDSEQLRVEEGGGGVFWWLWDAFLGASPEEPAAVVAQETEAASKQRTEETEGDRQDVEGPTDSAEASSSEALSKPLGTVRTQALPTSMVNTASTLKVSKSDSGPPQKCVIS